MGCRENTRHWGKVVRPTTLAARSVNSNPASDDPWPTSATRRRTVLSLVLVVILVGYTWGFLSDGSDFLAAIAACNPVWLILMAALASTFFGIRFIRWQYLLRRAAVRLPARGSLAIYLASLVGMVSPAYVGELSRSLFVRARFATPIRVTATVLFVERLLDVAALGLVGALATSQPWLRAAMLLLVGATIPAGWAVIGLAQRASVPRSITTNLMRPSVVLIGLALTITAWLVAGFLAAAAAVGLDLNVTITDGMGIFGTSTLLSGGILTSAGLSPAADAAHVQLQHIDVQPVDATALVNLWRLAIIGVGLLLGIAFCFVQLKSSRAVSTSDHTAHFDEIVDEYADQFSDHIWEYLLERKLTMITDALPTASNGSATGLDLGCGLGKQCLTMGRRGYRVVGIDSAVKLISTACRTGATVVNGDAMRLPFHDGILDFVYTIGVLHHLDGAERQRASCNEVMRVLKPDGLFLIHETNPRNPLFRFYMGYVFPLVKSIDTGTEWWINPRLWDRIHGFTLVDVKYFTFLPDFIPRSLLRSLAPVERRLESTPIREYSAHYMAILRKQRILEPRT